MPSKTFPRPIVAKFTSRDKKDEMMKEKKYLRGTDIYVLEDFSKRVIDERKALFEEARRKRANGESAFVRFNRLYTNKAMFKWDAREKLLVQMGGQIMKKTEEDEVELVLKKLELLDDIDDIEESLANMKKVAEYLQRPYEKNTDLCSRNKEKAFGN